MAKKTELAVMDSFKIANRFEGMDPDLMAELQDQMEDLDNESGISCRMVKIPSGGGLAYELFPVIRTTYDRSTLLAPDGAGRITVDTDLSWRLPDGATLDLPDLVIVETKSLSAASATDRLLWRAGHRPVPVSKFATGLAALNPDLPRNRWARILRGPFAARNLELAVAA